MVEETLLTAHGLVYVCYTVPLSLYSLPRHVCTSPAAAAIRDTGGPCLAPMMDVVFAQKRRSHGRGPGKGQHQSQMLGEKEPSDGNRLLLS